jgi:hypothetical protein
MTNRSFRRLLGKLIFTTAAAVPANAANAAPPGDGHALAIRLQQAHPLDATRIAATDATDATVEVRRALADALTWSFPLVGDALIIDHLAGDPDPEVRLAAARAAHARRATGGLAILERLTHDADASVREAAILGLHGR